MNKVFNIWAAGSIALLAVFGLSACGTRGEEDANYNYAPDPVPSDSVPFEWTDLGNELQSRPVKVGEQECLVVIRYSEFKVVCPGQSDVASGVTP